MRSLYSNAVIALVIYSILLLSLSGYAIWQVWGFQSDSLKYTENNPLSFKQVELYNAKDAQGAFNNFLVLRGAKPLWTSKDGRPVVTKNEERVFLDYKPIDKYVKLPVNNSDLTRIKWIITAALLLILAGSFLFGWQLYTYISGKREHGYYSAAGVQQMRNIGRLILLFGLISFLSTFSLAEYFAELIGYKGVGVASLALFDYIPVWLFVGMIVMFFAREQQANSQLKNDEIKTV